MNALPARCAAGMLEDMAMHGLREATQRDYIRFVHAFAAFLGQPPATASAAVRSV